MVQLLVVGTFLLLSMVILHKRREAARAAAREEEAARLRLEHRLREEGRDAMVPRIVKVVATIVKVFAFGFGAASLS